MSEILETRCVHDMLEWPELGQTSCAVCKGIASSPLAVWGDFGLLADEPEQTLRWFVVNEFDDRREQCSDCDEPLARGKRAAWSAERGNLCADCARTVA